MQWLASLLLQFSKGKKSIKRFLSFVTSDAKFTLLYMAPENTTESQNFYSWKLALDP